MTRNITTDVENRHEIVFLYDAERANPNGDPMSANDRPRIDKETGEAIVTDSRLKRYLRDQMTDDGVGVYLVNSDKTDLQAQSRDQLFSNIVSDKGEVPDEYDSQIEQFLGNATDVRMFGAPLSLQSTPDGMENPPSFTGPIQFGHGESLHRVSKNTESKKLSSVIASGSDSDTGTFAEDNRLQYALIRFDGTINENNAAGTGLMRQDIQYLDSLCWRALKNQTQTRSKQGHNPRLYLRAEYDNEYHVGDLKHSLSIDEERSKVDKKLRNISDLTLNIDELLTLLDRDNVAQNLQCLNIQASQYLTVSADGETGGPEFLYDTLSEYTEVNVINPYAE